MSLWNDTGGAVGTSLCPKVGQKGTSLCLTPSVPKWDRKERPSVSFGDQLLVGEGFAVLAGSHAGDLAEDAHEVFFVGEAA